MNRYLCLLLSWFSIPLATRYHLRPAALYGIRSILIGISVLMLVTAECLSYNLLNPDPQTLFNRGIYLMEEHNYIDALSNFQSIENQGYISGPLFYNMGLSYTYLDSLGKASFYFQKSTGFRSSRNQAQNGMAFIHEQMRSRGTYIPYLPWYALTDWFIFRINHFSGIVWSLVFLNLGVVVLLAGWLYRPNRWVAIAGGTTVAAGIFILTLNVGLFLWSQQYEQAVVITRQAPLHNEPVSHTSESSVSEINTPNLAYEGYTVTLNRSRSKNHSGWVFIRLQNGVTGWIRESSVRIL
ncbi:MAG: GW dipeptide domain-containing protein [Balneolales bacterium]